VRRRWEALGLAMFTGWVNGMAHGSETSAGGIRDPMGSVASLKF